MKNLVFTMEKSKFARNTSLFAKLNSVSSHKITCKILYFILLQQLASTSELKVRQT